MNNRHSFEKGEKVKPSKNTNCLKFNEEKIVNGHENQELQDELGNERQRSTNKQTNQKFVRLQNWITGKQVTDTLHQQANGVNYIL